jgi:hypothetical protein
MEDVIFLDDILYEFSAEFVDDQHLPLYILGSLSKRHEIRARNVSIERRPYLSLGSLSDGIE